MTRTMTTGRFPHHPENVPAELKLGERWVTCDEYKVPLIAIESGACFAASSTNPDTWRPYETALKTFSNNDHVSGIGRVITEDEDYAGVDLDDCVDPDTGEITPWANRIVDRLNSYSEISPSGSGIKIWVKAPELKTAYKKPGLEIYPRGRYFTVTGSVIGERLEITDAGDELAAIVAEEFPKVDRDRTTYDGPARVLDLDDFLERTDVTVFEVASDGAAERKYKIRCPWVSEHSGGDETGTYCGQYPEGALFFACYHAHCASRAWQDFRYHLEFLAHLGRPPRFGKGRIRWR